MSTDYVSSRNSVAPGLDISPKLNTSQNSAQSLDTRAYSSASLSSSSSSSNQGIEQGSSNLSNPGTFVDRESTTTFNANASTNNNTIYVNQNATGSNDGSSWSNAYIDLQAALTAALAGDQIWVAKGTYTPTTKTDRNASFSLKKFVGVYGGFAGYETSLSQRNWSNNPTILSGDISEIGKKTDDSYHVVNFTNTTNTSILDGFTITGGYADYNGGSGAGIYSTGAGNATLANLIISGNYASDSGGGMYETGSSPTLTHVIFRDNFAANQGGAMYTQYGQPTIINSIFYENSSTMGGAIFTSDKSNIPIINTTFNKNHADYGGALYNTSGEYLNSNNNTIQNSILWDNNGSIGGKEIYNISGVNKTTVTYSDIQGGYGTDKSNINVDPLFFDESNGDLRLQSGSPVINKGNNAALPSTEVTDLADNPRIVGGIVDLGAYEAFNNTKSDFNGDGKSDLLWRNSITGRDVEWFMNGSTIASSQDILPVYGKDWKEVGTGDFNGDGKTDILWRNLATGEDVVWIMNGSTLLASQDILAVPDQNWNIVGTGDFNNDGKTDILWRNYNTGQNVEWFMNGTTISSTQDILPVYDTNWQIVGTGDFNKDGKIDIVWRNKATGEDVAWFMNGTTISSAQALQAPAISDTNWHIMGTGDFNGDGNTDLVWRNSATGRDVIWFMNGITMSSYQDTLPVPDQNWQVVA